MICIQNHDQVGNRALGERFGTLLSPAQQRLAAGLLLISSHVPLIFMGEEYGETRPFPYFCSFLDPALVEAVRKGRREEHGHAGQNSGEPDPQSEATFAAAKLRWSWPDQSHAAGLRRLYQDLLQVRGHWPAFRDFHNRRAELLPSAESPFILRFVRAASSNLVAGALVAFFNLTGVEQRLVPAFHHDGGLLLSSESGRYRGRRRPSQPVESLFPFEFQLYGPTSWKRP